MGGITVSDVQLAAASKALIMVSTSAADAGGAPMRSRKRA